MESARTLFQISGTSQQVEDQLFALRESDKESEEAARAHMSVAGSQMKKALMSVGLVGIAYLICSTFVSRSSKDILFLGAILVGLCVGGYFIVKAIGASSAAGQARTGDIDDNLYQGLSRLHSFLKLDCTDTTLYDYEIDFSDPHAERFLLRSEPYRNGRESYYQQCKLKAKVKLRDGTSLKLQIDKLSRVRSYSKTNPRGKVKSKYKTKDKELVRLDLALNRSPTLTSVSGPNKKVKVSQNKVTVVQQTPIREHRFSIQPALQLAVETFQEIQDPKTSQSA